MSGDEFATGRIHAARYRQIGAAFRRHGLGFVSGMLGLDRVIPRRRSPGTFATAGIAAEAPGHLRAALEELGPTFIKLGQLLSTRSDLLPPAFIAELAKLQDAAPPVPPERIRAVIRGELGAEPESMFASFEDRPLASASIGQAHAATLRDGTPVVVKVRKPGAVQQVQVDLEILQNLAVRATRAWGFARDIDAVAVVDEFATTIRAELDYLQEGRNAERFWQNFEADASVVIPRVYWEFTTSRVLTLERMTGMNVADAVALDEAGVDRGLVARRGAQIVLKMIFEDRFFHADLHPGNLFIHDDSTLALIDFGMVGVIGGELRGHLARLFIAMVRGDAEMLASALIDVATTSASIDRMTLRDDLRPFLGRYRLRSVRQTPFAKMLAELFTILRGNRVRLPRELILLFKALLLIEALAIRLDPEFRLGEALTPYAERLSWERLRMSALAKRIARSSVDVGELALDLPGIVRRLVDAADTTGFQVHLRAAELEPLVQRTERIGNRLVAGMIGAALITGVGGLVAGERRWRSWEGGMLGAGLTTIGSIAAYLAWTARRRRFR
ncbi:AarF/ABC1/UbiB kinase family protein [Agromyces sp. H3Y2-19a]|uniref:ABC1 kinase family protein n=1 Tax=Agromyces chromiiresistens TaxID=3030835 RepID=UPI0023BA17CC|nr:AarF/ABC1/UbiB kinase family protein [Agromyces chromiiresistens]MDF0515617.1 AarF/ABC1/UbiB kinase family protein [Agromyces chromiiresistens]